MSDVPFHLTVMGRRFYERTLPDLVAAIEKLNEHLERHATRDAAGPDAPPPSPPAESE